MTPEILDTLITSHISRKRFKWGVWWYEPEQADLLLQFIESIPENIKDKFISWDVRPLLICANVWKDGAPLSRLQKRAIRVAAKKEKGNEI
jgi:hypothetical protein